VPLDKKQFGSISLLREEEIRFFLVKFTNERKKQSFYLSQASSCKVV
jgi:hypothetical protein